MASVNKWIGIGNLGRDPEVRYSAGGDAIANISIGCSESWKDKNGEKQEKTEWVRVSFFGKTAEVVGQYLKKGSQVYVEGRIQTRKWVNKEGVDQYTTEIVADRMQMLGSKPDGQAPREQPAPARQPAEQEPDFTGMGDEEIPF